MVVDEVREAVRRGGLLAQGRPIVAMLSGGRDSTCLLDVAVALCGPTDLSALHVNYGLRERADAEQDHCVALCRALTVELEVVHAGDGAGGEAASRGGNMQAWARELRYAAAERTARARDALIATGHTASDQVETILYRLAASPGRRALLGMVAGEPAGVAPAEHQAGAGGAAGPDDRSDTAPAGVGARLIRPLLGVTRAQTAAYCEARGLRWCEDESNRDVQYARTRVRHGLLAALRAVHPAAEANVLRTAALLREETELLDGLVEEALQGRRSISIVRLAEMPTALARMVVVRLAEDAAGTYVPQAGERVPEILALGARGGRAELHVGGRAGAVIEDGVLAMVKLPPR